eukprot:scaffold713_cov185-Ochromonas_danica.AAC.3
MSSRSLLLQLPRDILHSVYSEWLPSWRDLSRLDAACVREEDREAWLCSLRELSMKSEEILKRLYRKESLRRWYEWVISRKVLLVRFPVWLSVLADFNLTTELDFGSYCRSIHSIEIKNDFFATERFLDSNMWSGLGNWVKWFVRQCVNLKGVRYCCDCENDGEDYEYDGEDSENDGEDSENDGEDSEKFDRDIHNLVFSALEAGLNSNTLESIDIDIVSELSTFIENKILKFLANQVSRLEDFKLHVDGSKESVDKIMNILHENRSPLKRLSLLVDHISWQKLLVCLSSVGVHLETLEVKGDRMPTTADYVKGEFLSTLGRSCPQLRRLKLFAPKLSAEISVSKLYQFYELCPNLISFNSSPWIVIDVNDQDGLEYRLDGIDQLLREEKEMFLECVRLAIQRSPCKLTISNQPFCCDLIEQYNDWVLFKSKLCPYLTDLKGKMSESILIEAVKELPRLEKLDINLETEKFSDLSLAAIMEYGYGLKILTMYNDSEYIPEQYSFSDEMISKLIRSCKLLEELYIPGAGLDSVLAAKHHLMLRSVCLEYVKVSKEEVSRLLLVDEREGEEKCAWRRLQEGEISAPEQYSFDYIEKDGRSETDRFTNIYGSTTLWERYQLPFPMRGSYHEEIARRLFTTIYTKGIRRGIDSSSL